MRGIAATLAVVGVLLVPVVSSGADQVSGFERLGPAPGAIVPPMPTILLARPDGSRPEVRAFDDAGEELDVRLELKGHIAVRGPANLWGATIRTRQDGKIQLHVDGVTHVQYEVRDSWKRGTGRPSWYRVALNAHFIHFDVKPAGWRVTAADGSPPVVVLATGAELEIPGPSTEPVVVTPLWQDGTEGPIWRGRPRDLPRWRRGSLLL